MDSVFGVVVFNEVTTDVKWGVKSGTITRTIIATNPGEDYSFFVFDIVVIIRGCWRRGYEGERT